MTDIRFITSEEIPDFRRAIARGFGDDLVDSEGADERFASIFPLETTIAAFDRGQIVATFGSFDLEMTVPGAVLPMAGTTIVTVHPTHRRRGILRTMMRMHLEQAVERRQPIAGLWASEATIYGRFGYGTACLGTHLTISTDRVTLPPGPSDVTIRPVAWEEAKEVLPGIYDRVRRTRPGLYARSTAWWSARLFRDPQEARRGATAFRVVVAVRDDQVVGYVMYRQRGKWEDGVSVGAVEVDHVVAEDDGARRALWSFLAGIDLFPSVQWQFAAVDEPLLLEVSDPRRLMCRVSDTLWVRILDVVAALGGRRYERDGRLVLGVEDAFLSTTGTYALDVAKGVPTVIRTEASPDVTLDVATLGALFMGGRSAVQLARAGCIGGDPDAVRLADDLFRTARAPTCIEVF